MTLQSSGAISIANINTELGRASNASSNLNESALRSLAGVASGAIAISNFYGKSYGDPSGIIKSPSLAFVNTSSGATSWTGASDAIVQDAVYATNTMGGPGVNNSQLLVLTGFGFNIPSYATIAGVAVIVFGRESIITSVTTARLWNGSSTTLNQQVGTTNLEIPFTISDSSKTVGSNTEKWGTNTSQLNPTVVNSSTFGVAIQTAKPVANGSHVTRIDKVQMQVYYA